MRLLFITQKLDANDDNLGFFHGWLEKFSEKLDKVYVICLWKGDHRLPQNVRVFSLGKERGVPKIGQLLLLQKHLFRILPEVDGVFVHMSPIYAIMTYPFAKIFRKKMVLWFLHKSVNWKLKLAGKLVDNILTASEESCRLKDRRKIKIVGHGIDTEKFQIPRLRQGFGGQAKLQILSAGRIAPIKDQETLIRAVDILARQNNIRDIRVKIVGAPLEAVEKRYLQGLKDLVTNFKLESHIEFLGPVSHDKMPELYAQSDIFVSLSQTGSIDKTVLEAMALSKPVLTCNEAFTNILPSKYLFRKGEPQDLARKLIMLRQAEEDPNLREIVVKNHNLGDLIRKIIGEFQ